MSKPQKFAPINRMILGIIAIILSFASCSDNQNKNYPAYGYKYFSGVTGITSALVVDGVDVAIKFSQESDPLIVGAFRNLGWEILHGNADGKRIQLYGILDNETKKTAEISGGAQVEEYREFTLKFWSIQTPLEYRIHNEELPVQMESTEKPSLKAAGYDSFRYWIWSVDYADFEVTPEP